MRCKQITLMYLVLSLMIVIWFHDTGVCWAEQVSIGCLGCHEGIESIMPEDNDMMLQIEEMGGDYGSCAVCHGGNPLATTKKEAHQGAPEDIDLS